MKSAFVRVMFMLLLAALFSGCALMQPKDDVVPKRFFWPQEPDEPKIEWIATYFGDISIKEKTFMSEIIGVDASVTFARPVSVAGDGEGRIVIADQEKGLVYFFNLNEHEAAIYGGSSGAASFNLPSAVTVDPEGNFYVADNATRKIYIADGKNKISSVLDLSGQVKSIGAITIDRVRKHLIVPDARGGDVIYFTLTGEYIKTLSGKGYFTYPNAVAVTSDGTLFIADSFNATILRFTPEGKYVSSIGRRGDSPGNLTLATCVAVDSEDHIYVTDGRLHNVTIFDKDNNALLVIGGQHSVQSGNIARGGFSVPQGISIDKNDRIYVADSLNRRVQVFQYLNEKYLKQHPIEKPAVLPVK